MFDLIAPFVGTHFPWIAALAAVVGFGFSIWQDHTNEPNRERFAKKVKNIALAVASLAGLGSAVVQPYLAGVAEDKLEASQSAFRVKQDELNDKQDDLLDAQASQIDQLKSTNALHQENNALLKKNGELQRELINYETGGDGFFYLHFARAKRTGEIEARLCVSGRYPISNIKVHITDLDKKLAMEREGRTYKEIRATCTREQDFSQVWPNAPLVFSRWPNHTHSNSSY
ncbi:hypothetical protein [Aeoliella sp.]|uniref:hypothetical protein n=1 Tax=Aeoliella sp. TaxID=2795800 RepID=UPI003CCC0253